MKVISNTVTILESGWEVVEASRRAEQEFIRTLARYGFCVLPNTAEKWWPESVQNYEEAPLEQWEVDLLKGDSDNPPVVG